MENVFRCIAARSVLANRNSCYSSWKRSKVGRSRAIGEAAEGWSTSNSSSFFGFLLVSFSWAAAVSEGHGPPKMQRLAFSKIVLSSLGVQVRQRASEVGRFLGGIPRGGRRHDGPGDGGPKEVRSSRGSVQRTAPKTRCGGAVQLKCVQWSSGAVERRAARWWEVQWVGGPAEGPFSGGTVQRPAWSRRRIWGWSGASGQCRGSTSKAQEKANKRRFWGRRQSAVVNSRQADPRSNSDRHGAHKTMQPQRNTKRARIGFIERRN